MQLNRSISYTASWKYTILISLIISGILSFILIFLQPFDTYAYQIDDKLLRLIGYSGCIIFPIVLLHALEQALFLRNGKKWYFLNEILIISIGFVLMIVLSAIYNHVVVNNLKIGIYEVLDWILYFGLPFAPIFLPFWAYLRYRFSQITIQPKAESQPNVLTIQGSNANEELQFDWNHFLMAHSQSNYVDIYLVKEQEIKKHVLRSTLSGLVEQLPKAHQVHRSYLINADHINQLEGNTRKGWVELRHLSEKVPVSPKHFSALKKHLQTRPNSSN